MNRSKQYTVKHEARGFVDQKTDNLVNINNDFKQDYYGEVNSYLRFYIGKINAGKVGILVRDTKEIWTSMCNRRDYKTLEWKVKNLHWFYTECLPNIPVNHHIIEFSKLTTNKEYLYNTLLYFGISDVDVDSIDLSIKVNKNVNIQYKTFDDLPDNLKQLYGNYDFKYL